MYESQYIYALIQWAHECTKQNPTKKMSLFFIHLSYSVSCFLYHLFTLFLYSHVSSLRAHSSVHSIKCINGRFSKKCTFQMHYKRHKSFEYLNIGQMNDIDTHTHFGWYFVLNLSGCCVLFYTCSLFPSFSYFYR